MARTNSAHRYGIRLLALLAVAWTGGCGGSNAGTGDDDGGASATDADNSCTSTEQCPGDQVCNPATGHCTDENVPCSSHEECGAAAFCDDDGNCAPNTSGGPCDGDENCISGETCTGGFCGCEGVQFQAESVPPNVLIVLDRSGSMDDSIGGGSTKWELAVAAVKTLLTDYGDSVRFGLVLYSSDGDCGPGQVLVGVGDGTAADINGEMDGASPDGSTPIGDTLDGLVSYAGLGDTTRDNYILLLTDGEERCDGDGEAAVTALRNRTPEVKTFVVGFGGEVDPDALNAMAVAGGTDLPGATKYYQADDAAALQAAFDAIGGSVLSCSYELSEIPPDLDELYVYFDSVGIPRDTGQVNGWDYNPDTNEVTFYGPACDSLRSGSVTDLVIVYGCPIDIP